MTHRLFTDEENILSEICTWRDLLRTVRIPPTPKSGAEPPPQHPSGAAGQPPGHQPSASRGRQGQGEVEEKCPQRCHPQGPLRVDKAAWASFAFPTRFPSLGGLGTFWAEKCNPGDAAGRAVRARVWSKLWCALSAVFLGTTRKYTWRDVCLIFSFLSPRLHPHPDKNEQKLKWKGISGMLLQVSRQRKKISIEEEKFIIFDKASQQQELLW